MKQFYARLAVILLFLFTINCFAVAENEASGPPASAVTNPAKPNTTTTAEQPAPEARLWNLQNADILSVINEVSLETGKNFVVDPRVTGKISLVSSKPIKPDEVYNVFLSVLELLGYSAIQSGNVVKIVPNMESGEYATRVATQQNPGRSGEVVVRVIPLENVAANQLIPVIRPLMPQWSNVSAYTPGNVIILLGRAANINRIVTIIHNIDRSGSNDIEIVPLHQASATQVASVLANLQNAARATGDTPQVSIGADERSNSVLLSGNKSARLHMRYLITRLDTPTTGSQANTEVIYLRYLLAKKLAPVLGKTAQNMLGKEEHESPNSNSPITYGPSPGQGRNRGGSQPENLTNIQAEESTNALIITAPPSIMRALKSIVAKLDIRPAQVLVEAIVVEIDQNDLNNLGIQWGSHITNEQNSFYTGQGFPDLGANIFGIIPSVQFRAVVSMLQNKTGVNILSTPSVVVLDNHKATLEVGTDIPEQTGSYATTGSTSTVTPFNTIARKSVTLRLDVTPQINLGNAVRLSIDLNNNSLQNPDNPGLNPLINKSEIKNSVLINSEDTVVLGGLMSNSLTDSTDQIPVLGDIPVIGNLFRHKTRKMEKKNLMVFIKPTIIHDATDACVVTNTKYNNVRNTQINWPVNLSPNDQKRQNILPLWKNNVDLPKPFSAG